jgi:hypothetical protein
MRASAVAVLRDTTQSGPGRTQLKAAPPGHAFSPTTVGATSRPAPHLPSTALGALIQSLSVSPAERSFDEHDGWVAYVSYLGGDEPPPASECRGHYQAKPRTSFSGSSGSGPDGSRPREALTKVC